MKLEEKQESHINTVISNVNSNPLTTLSLLTGGPGTGKTFVTSELIKRLPALGFNLIICAFPSHASKFVFARELLRALGITHDDFQFKEFKKSEDSEERLTINISYEGTLIILETCHKLCGLVPYKDKGKWDLDLFQDEGKAKTQSAKFGVIKSALLIDEASMIAPNFLFPVDSRNKDPEDIIIPALDNENGRAIAHNCNLVHLSGDFDQLYPVKREESIESYLDEFTINETLLTKNYRAEHSDIAAFVDQLKLDNFSLPSSVDEYRDVEYVKDREVFDEMYRQSLQAKEFPMLVVHTNKQRLKYERMGAGLYGEKDIIFPQNVVLAAGSTDKYNHDSKRSVALIQNQEELIIDSVYEEEEVINMEWSSNCVAAPRCDVTTQITGAKLEDYYLLESEGSNTEKPTTVMSTRLQNYREQISKIYDHVSAEKVEGITSLKELCKSLRTSKYPAVHEFADYSEIPTTMLFNIFMKYFRWEGLKTEYPTPMKAVGALVWGRFGPAVFNKVIFVKSLECMTCHTAQGNGRDIVFLDFPNILLNTKTNDKMTPKRIALNKDTRRRLTYVGCSRAKKKLIILRRN